MSTDLKRSKRGYDSMVRWTEPAMLAVTALFVTVALVGEVESISDSTRDRLAIFEWALWCFFPLEFLVMLSFAPSRERFLRDRWWEIPIMLLTIPRLDAFLAWLAPVRFLRFLRAGRTVRALRLTRLGGLVARYTRGIRVVLTRHGLHYVLIGAVFLYGISTFAVYLVERGGSRPIQSPGEALWWGITAITTLPDDGNVPVTTAGKGIAVFIVFLGLTVVSLITANIAAFLVKSESDKDSQRLEEIAAKLDRIEAAIGTDGLEPKAGE